MAKLKYTLLRCSYQRHFEFIVFTCTASEKTHSISTRKMEADILLDDDAQTARDIAGVQRKRGHHFAQGFSHQVHLSLIAGVLENVIEYSKVCVQNAGQ